MTSILKKQSALAVLAILMLMTSACKDNPEGPKEGDIQTLETMMAEISALSAQEKCENAAEWRFRPIGSKACGGPTGYVSYSVKIDTNAFIQKVNKYTEAQAVFNKKWGIASDCMYVSPPKYIICENEKPKLVYQ